MGAYKKIEIGTTGRFAEFGGEHLDIATFLREEVVDETGASVSM